MAKLDEADVIIAKLSGKPLKIHQHARIKDVIPFLVKHGVVRRKTVDLKSSFVVLTTLTPWTYRGYHYVAGVPCSFNMRKW